jgi:uncharacterized protein (DUF433 family)
MQVSFSHIVCTEQVLCGSPRLEGRRLAIGDVVSLVNNYGTFDQVKQDFELTNDEIKQALLYCSLLKCKEDKPMVYCHNCSLRAEQEEPIDFSNLEEDSLEGTPIVKHGSQIYFGTLQEYLEEHRGKDWWKVATDLLIDKRDKLNL